LGGLTTMIREFVANHFRYVTLSIAPKTGDFSLTYNMLCESIFIALLLFVRRGSGLDHCGSAQKIYQSDKYKTV
jgi:hypothetical protein